MKNVSVLLFCFVCLFFVFVFVVLGFWCVSMFFPLSGFVSFCLLVFVCLLCCGVVYFGLMFGGRCCLFIWMCVFFVGSGFGFCFVMLVFCLLVGFV